MRITSTAPGRNNGIAPPDRFVPPTGFVPDERRRDRLPVTDLSIEKKYRCIAGVTLMTMTFPRSWTAAIETIDAPPLPPRRRAPRDTPPKYSIDRTRRTLTELIRSAWSIKGLFDRFRPTVRGRFGVSRCPPGAPRLTPCLTSRT